MMSGAMSRMTSRATCRGTWTRGEDKVVDATSGATSRMTSRATCQGTRTRGEDEVVDDEPAQGGVVDDERRDEPHDEPRDVPRYSDARRRRSSR
jgi:hypothetical protein